MEDGKVVRGYQKPLSDWGDPNTQHSSASTDASNMSNTSNMSPAGVLRWAKRAAGPQRPRGGPPDLGRNMSRRVTAALGERQLCVVALILEPLGPLSNPDPRLVKQGVGTRLPSTGGSLGPSKTLPVVVRGIAGGSRDGSVTAVVPDRPLRRPSRLRGLGRNVRRRLRPRE
jgi:hypothetical protein